MPSCPEKYNIILVSHYQELCYSVRIVNCKRLKTIIVILVQRNNWNTNLLNLHFKLNVYGFLRTKCLKWIREQIFVSPNLDPFCPREFLKDLLFGFFIFLLFRDVYLEVGFLLSTKLLFCFLSKFWEPEPFICVGCHKQCQKIVWASSWKHFLKRWLWRAFVQFLFQKIIKYHLVLFQLFNYAKNYRT